MTEDDDIQEAHRRSIRHRDEVLASEKCGCFYCLENFPPSSISTWADSEATALCPFCGIDAVIGSASGFPVTREFLERMRKYWF